MFGVLVLMVVVVIGLLPCCLEGVFLLYLCYCFCSVLRLRLILIGCFNSVVIDYA